MCICVSASVISCTFYILSTKILIGLAMWGHFQEVWTFWLNWFGFRIGLQVGGFFGMVRVSVSGLVTHYVYEIPQGEV